MDFVGDCIQDGTRFRLLKKATSQAPSTFTARRGDSMHVTRRLADLFDLPDETPVLAHWHGERRTDGFRLTVGALKALAEQHEMET